jgi:LacI family transcriptional regulator
MSIEKVAKLAGVSNSTVSRVINDHPRVAPETMKAVRAAMASLAYTPSDRRPGPKPAARGRVATANIAFLLVGVARNATTPAFEQLLRGVSSAAADTDTRLAFAHVEDADDLPARIAEQQFDGLLLHGAAPAKTERLRNHPCVWLMGNRRRPDWGDQVMPDTYDIGAKAASHLIGRGHKRLAYLNLDAGHWSFTLARHAFESVAANQGATVNVFERPRIESSGYWPAHTTEAAEELVDRLLALSPLPTGILIADDMQSAILQPLLQRRGVKIGEGNTEIVSVNNEKPFLLGLHPRPAVLDLRFELVGRRGVEQLLWRIEHASSPERIITAVEPLLVTNQT